MSCIVCGKSSTVMSRLADPFGKLDVWHNYCEEHAPKFTFFPCPCKACAEELAPRPVQQIFWKCAHHPIATQNFFDGRKMCEWGCQLQKLEPHHSGFYPTPLTWTLHTPYDTARAFR